VEREPRAARKLRRSRRAAGAKQLLDCSELRGEAPVEPASPVFFLLARITDEERELMAHADRNKAQDKLHETIHAAARSVSQTPETVQQAEATTSDSVRALSDATRVLTEGMQQISREGAGLAQQRFKANLDGFAKLFTCRNVQDFTAVQNELARSNLEEAFSSLRRIAELSIEVANKGSQKVTKAMTAAQEPRRAA
jgi:hypothetical protein